MRVQIMAAAFLLGLFSWTAARDGGGDSKQSLGREAYELSWSFYEYDRVIPLDERTTVKFEIPGARVRKAVLRSCGANQPVRPFREMRSAPRENGSASGGAF